MSISFISKSICHFLLSYLFWKLSQSLGQDQPNSKQIYFQLPIIIFLWTPKGLIFPESFLNFLLNLYIPPWLPKCFKFIVLRLLQIHLWVKKLNLFNFTHAPKQNSSPGVYPEQHFLKIFFLEQKEEVEDYISEKSAKIDKGFGHKFW